MNDAKIRQMHVALRRIKSYESTKWLRKHAETNYGISYHEALEMAYENVIEEAKTGLRGVRLAEASSLGTKEE